MVHNNTYRNAKQVCKELKIIHLRDQAKITVKISSAMQELHTKYVYFFNKRDTDKENSIRGSRREKYLKNTVMNSIMKQHVTDTTTHTYLIYTENI
jgi:hypothetical protein